MASIHLVECFNETQRATVNTLGKAICALHLRAHVMHGGVSRIDCAKANPNSHFVLEACDSDHDVLLCVPKASARCVQM